MNKIVIALEGIDGAGKSSIVDILKKKYGNKIDVYYRTKKGRIIDRFVSCKFIQDHYMLQVPVYILLSHINYIKYLTSNKNNLILIMDRCFLSNVCYFFPKALNNKVFMKCVMFFEPRIIPHKIYLLDVMPNIAQQRDQYKKKLVWLSNTRNYYIESQSSKLLAVFDIQIINEAKSLESKASIIIKYIEEKLKQW